MPLVRRLPTPQSAIRNTVLRRVVVFFATTLLVALVALPATAASPPPGPQQGTGPWAENGKVIDTWEEYPGGMLLIFNPKWVFQANPGGCSFSDYATCYTWEQYEYFSADPYNTTYWVPYARGCMVLGADPLKVGTAAGYSQQTDLHTAGENWVPSLKPLQTDAATNPNASGGALPPDETLIPQPFDYDHCFTGGGPSTGTVVGRCYMDYSGNWNGQVSDRTNTVIITQQDQKLFVSITAGPVFDDEATFLNDTTGTWSVVFTGNSSFNFVDSTLKAHVGASTLTVSGEIAGPVLSSTFGLEVKYRNGSSGWTLDTCNISL